MLRLGGQARHLLAGERVVITGWDMGAALAVAAALGVPARLAAECLPEIEAAMVSASAAAADDVTEKEGLDDE